MGNVIPDVPRTAVRFLPFVAALGAWRVFPFGTTPSAWVRTADVIMPVSEARAGAGASAGAMSAGTCASFALAVASCAGAGASSTGTGASLDSCSGPSMQ